MIPNWRETNKRNPCPICKKPDWCMEKDDGAIMCMRTHLDQAGEWYKHASGYNSNNEEFTIYRQEKRPQKAVRPAQYREWVYHYLDGKPAIKVCRRDHGDGRKKEMWQRTPHGKRWVNKGLTKEQRAQVKLYRSKEITKAIAAQEKIFVVEGEATADAIVEKGLQATTALGGSGFHDSDWEQLKNASVVLCPDTDSKSVKYFDRIAQIIPKVEWLYVYPDSFLWRNLTEGGGLDLYDYIQEKKCTAEDLMNLVVSDRKEVVFLKPKDPNEQIPITEAVSQVIDQDLPKAKVTEALRQIRGEYNYQTSEVREIYQDLLKDKQATENLKDSREENQELINLHDVELDLRSIFPKPLAEALLVKAETIRVDPNRMVAALLAACGKSLGGKIPIFIRRDADKGGWKQYPVIFAGDVAPPSWGKSTLGEAIHSPLEDAQAEENERYKEALKSLAAVKDRWGLMTQEEKRQKVDTDENPRIFAEENCKNITHIIQESTTEALFRRMSEQDPEHGLLCLQDELLGFFKGLNQYSKKGGNALQLFLSLWNGRTYTGFNRSNLTDCYNATGQTFSLYGGIQPEVFKQAFDVENDSNGLASRFLFCVARRPKDAGKWCYKTASVYDRLKWLYDKLASLPSFECDYTPEAQKLFIERYEEIHRQIDKCEGVNNGLMSYLGKQHNMVARLSLILHLIDCCYDDGKDWAKISEGTLRRAIYLNDFFIGQFKLLQLQNTKCPERKLDQMLLKAISYLKKHGTAEVRKFSNSYNKAKYSYQGDRINTATTRKIFRELVILGYATLNGDTLTLVDKDPPSSPPPPPPPPPTPPNGNGNGNGNGNTPVSPQPTPPAPPAISSNGKVTSNGHRAKLTTSNYPTVGSSALKPMPEVPRNQAKVTPFKAQRSQTNGYTTANEPTGTVIFDGNNSPSPKPIAKKPVKRSTQTPKSNNQTPKSKKKYRNQVKEILEASPVPEESSPWKDKFYGTSGLESVSIKGELYNVIFDLNGEEFTQEIEVKPDGRTVKLTVAIKDCDRFYYPQRTIEQSS